MVKTDIEPEWAPVMKKIEISKIGELRWDSNGSFLIGLAVEDLRFVTVCPYGSGKIGQPDRLGPNGGLIEIPDGRLNKEDLHLLTKDLRNEMKTGTQGPSFG
jgi:hypothetical protein